MIWTPTGHRIESRAQLPTGDLRLTDGRTLKFLGRAPLAPPGSFAWGTSNGLRVLASMDDSHEHGVLLHVSMSYRSRDPSWNDIKAVRAAFFPETIDVMMVLPKAADYVNVHEHTFHLWQTPTAWDIQ